MNKRRIVITGGHHSSALVVAKFLIDQGWEVSWIGHRHSMEKDAHDSAEYQEVTRAEIAFYNLRAAKMYRFYHPWRLVRVAAGCLRAARLLQKIRPQVILTFGGYLAPPVALVGWLMKIPIVTHEQTISPGLANRFVGRLARKICLTWPESARAFPAGKTVLTGLPLRPELMKPGGKITFAGKKPVVYITGGKQGSHVINMAVYECLDKLLLEYNCLHQTGDHSAYRDLERLQKKAKSLGSLARGYRAKAYFFTEEIGRVFRSADVVVGRSGAHFCAEVLFFKVPAVLIPLPFSSHREQQKQAQVVVRSGLAVLLPQRELSGQSLLGAIRKAVSQVKTEARKSVHVRYKQAVTAIAAEIESVCD